MMPSEMQNQILTFWFGEPGSPDYDSIKSFWFGSTPAIDADIKSKFEEAHSLALSGNLDSLSETPDGSLALIILLDQFPRNIYRGTPQAFSSDPQALKIAKNAIVEGFDKDMTDVQKMFLYLPFQHSEDLKDQEASVKLYKDLGNSSALDYAQMHYDIVKQFGRFPHRNKILGRVNTQAETEYINNPDTPSFGQG